MQIDNQKLDWAIDVPVAINFFSRPDTFERTFKEVCKARPSKLFLIADGPRPNRPDDVRNCLKCRKIASGGGKLELRGLQSL